MGKLNSATTTPPTNTALVVLETASGPLQMCEKKKINNVYLKRADSENGVFLFILTIYEKRRHLRSHTTKNHITGAPGIS